MAGYIGSRSVALSTTAANVEDITATDTSPEVTLVNTTHEDTDGGREGKVIFKGQQSGGEESTLAEIEASHDGTSDDEKGDLIFRTNDGSDGSSPTERLRIDSNGSIIPATLGTDNVHLGEGAGDSITSGGDNNVAIGKNAATALTTGDLNVAVGSNSLKTISTHSNNTVIGAYALDAGTGNNNTAVGSGALGGASYAADSNAAFGRDSGTNITSGSDNAMYGTNSGNSLTTGSSNTLIGDDAGYFLQSGGDNTFIGKNCAQNVTTGGSHTVIGKYTGNGHGIDIRTAASGNAHIILSTGNGKPNGFFNEGSSLEGVWYFGNYTDNQYWPVTASNSSRAAVVANNGYGTLGVTSIDDPLFLNRATGDGLLVRFYSSGTEEGNISVSGSTVSYNGGHLSRWSQLADGSKDTSILKGTVMTNLDQMCVWSHDAVAEGDTIKNAMGETITATADDVADAYTENNEQLNCMAVSSVEGDANVAGVFFFFFSTDDGFNDMNVAMTGDMVIRIAQGTTVARGDLLMSAGDGTAKPQGDDIVRSKTIAKVTSTNVSHTYDDGSYLVPCVLMAC